MKRALHIRSFLKSHILVSWRSCAQSLKVEVKRLYNRRHLEGIGCQMWPIAYISDAVSSTEWMEGIKATY